MLGARLFRGHYCNMQSCYCNLLLLVKGNLSPLFRALGLFSRSAGCGEGFRGRDLGRWDGAEAVDREADGGYGGGVSGEVGGRLRFFRFWRLGRWRRSVFSGLRLGSGFVFGFVWRIGGGGSRTVVEGAEELEVFDRAAVLSFGLGLIAEEEANGIGLVAYAAEARGGPVGAVLVGMDTGVDDEVLVGEDENPFRLREDIVQAEREEAGFEGGESEQDEVGEGDAVDRGALLGGSRLVSGDGVGLEVGDEFGIFDADDGELSGVEGGLAGILRRAGFTFGGAGSGGVGGVGSVGSELFGGSWLLWHGSGVAREGRLLPGAAG
jgi:hypothetical protein